MGMFSRLDRSAAMLAAAQEYTGDVVPILRAARAAPYNAPRAMHAAATRLTPEQMTATAVSRSVYSHRQETAWGHYDAIGEVHFGFTLVANVFSRVRLYAGNVTDPTEVPTALDVEGVHAEVPTELARRAEALVAELVLSDFSGLLRTFSLNMNVAGEVLFVRLDDQWTFRSTSEIEVRQDGVYLVAQRGQMGRKLGNRESISASRIWRQHPRYFQEPDSSLMAVADACDELLLVSRMVRSAVRTRLNAGVLFVPDGVVVAARTIAPIEDPDTGEIVDVTDPGGTFLAELMEAMVTPVSDEASVANVVPMVVTGPSDLGKEIRHITFPRESDEWLVNRAERALERVLQGIDVPKDIVTGLASVKYSNAIVIDEGLYKAHIEPASVTLVDALTDVYLRPALLAEGFDQEDVERVAIWYDPSEIVTRPNQAQDSSDGYDRYLVSGDAWRREHGFADTDAPSEEELAFMLLMEKGELPPEVTTTLLNTVLPSVLKKAQTENLANSAVPFPDTARDLLGLPGGPSGGEGPPAPPTEPPGPPPGGTPAPVPPAT